MMQARISSRTTRSVALALILAAACADGTSPPTTSLITLGGCLLDDARYFAYRNEGADWVELPAGFGTTVTFAATNRVEIVFGPEGRRTTIRATRSELEGLECQTAPMHYRSGSVANLASDELFAIGAGGSHQLIYPPYTSPSFIFATDSLGPSDIVATISAPASTFDRSRTRKVIVRRSVDPMANLAVFDATGPEAIAPASAVISATLAVGAEAASVSVGLLTAGGTRTVLPAGVPSGTPFTIPILPSELSSPGDVYRVQYVVFSDSLSRILGRGTGRYGRDYLGPTDAHSMTLGPMLQSPVWSNSMSPHLERQAAYPGLASITYSGSHGRTATIICTRGYMDEGATEWDLHWSDKTSFVEFAEWSASAEDGTLNGWLGYEIWEVGTRYRWATLNGTVE